MSGTVNIQSEPACCKCGEALTGFHGVYMKARGSNEMRRYCETCARQDMACPLCGQFKNDVVYNQ